MGNINNYCGNLSYNKEIQKDESTAFPDIGDGLNYIFNFFDTDSYKDGVTFNWQETLDMGATYSNEGIAAYGRTISTKDIIGAKNSISFNSTDLTTVANAESYIYSSNGDISIQANTVDLNGLIYAPNGKVLISAGNIDFEGLIIADEIEVNGNDVTLSASPFNSYNIDFLTNIINDARIITVADYYLDESKMTLSWDTNQYGNNFTIWASYDGGDYIAIADTDECTYDYIAESGYQTIDFYVEQELLSGNKMISNTVSLTANENGEYEVYMEDSDGDGLCDPLEDYLGTDKNNANTDDDGLTDYEELYYTQTDPLKYDSDDNGICDADEDIDEDGLSFRQELDLTTDPFNNDTDFDGLSDGDEVNVYGTDPLKKDTDDDGLIDGKEPEYSCDPLNPDSNYDGILDGDDTYTVTKKSKESDSKVSVELTMDIPGKSIGSLSIDEVPDDDIFLPAQMPGFIGNGFDFYVDCEFEEATMKYTFDESLLDIENFEPAVYYCDVVNQKMVLLEEQVVDLENCTVTAKTTHFSRYILLNKTEFEKIWDNDFIDNSTDEAGNKVGMEIALVIDSSGSMGWNDLSGIRKDAAKEFVDSLRDEDKAAIIDFDHYAYTYQGLTNNKKLLYNAINKIDDNGGTSLSAGMSMALDNLLNSASDAKKIIIMLTDGVGDYDSKYTTIASNNEITVYTIGLGYDIDSVLLNNIATATGGKYYHADKAEDLKDNFEEAQEDIGTKDTDGDTLPDVVEENLYWFNGVSLSAANKPSDIDLFLGFKSDDPNTFYKYLNDGQLVREYKQISENRYEAVLKDGVIWDIPSFQEKLNENKKEIVDKYVEEVCDELDFGGTYRLLEYDDKHHVLDYHSNAHEYECIYCKAKFLSPEIQDNEILCDSNKGLFSSLTYIQGMSDIENFDKINFALKSKIRESYTCVDVLPIDYSYCKHGHISDERGDLCTPYSSSDQNGNYTDPSQYCLNKGYDCSILGNYQISIDVKTVDITDTLRDTVVNTITVYVDNFATEQTTKAFIISSVGLDNYNSWIESMKADNDISEMKILKGISSGVVDENAKILKNGETDLSTDEYFYRLGSATAKKLLDLGLNSVPPLKVINKTYKILKTLYTNTVTGAQLVENLPSQMLVDCNFINFNSSNYDIYNSYEIKTYPNFMLYDYSIDDFSCFLQNESYHEDINKNSNLFSANSRIVYKNSKPKESDVNNEQTCYSSVAYRFMLISDFNYSKWTTFDSSNPFVPYGEQIIPGLSA